jgi:hypothetical protein
MLRPLRKLPIHREPAPLMGYWPASCSASTSGSRPSAPVLGFRRRADKLAAMKLSRTITLRDGRGFSTVSEAVAIMSELPKARQLRLVWQTTAAILIEAQRTGNDDDMRHATAQLCRALQAEGWMI